MKNYLKKYMPDKQSMRETWLYRRFGNHIMHPSLWAFNRRSVAMAVAIGVFCAFVPIPAQMLLAALIAMWMRVNVPLAIAAVWISNPLTTVPIYYGSYLVGVGLFYIMQIGPEQVLNFQHIGHLMQCLVPPFNRCQIGISASEFWPPLLVGLMVTGVVSSIVAYYITHRLWIRRSKRDQIKRQIRQKLATKRSNTAEK